MIFDPLEHRAMEEIVAAADAMDAAVTRRTWALLNGIDQTQL